MLISDWSADVCSSELLAGKLVLSTGDAIAARPPTATSGLVVTNPPYGERLASEAELVKLYSLLGVSLKQNFPGWRFGFFTARDDLSPRLGLRAEKISSLYNGAIPCKLLRFEIADAPVAEIGRASWRERVGQYV